MANTHLQKSCLKLLSWSTGEDLNMIVESDSVIETSFAKKVLFVFAEGFIEGWIITSAGI